LQSADPSPPIVGISRLSTRLRSCLFIFA
jgi:hypothetical protein